MAYTYLVMRFVTEEAELADQPLETIEDLADLRRSADCLDRAQEFLKIGRSADAAGALRRAADWATMIANRHEVKN